MCGDNLEQECSASTGLDIFIEYPSKRFSKKDERSFFALSSPPRWYLLFFESVSFFLNALKFNKSLGLTFEEWLICGGGNIFWVIILCQLEDQSSLLWFSVWIPKSSNSYNLPESSNLLKNLALRFLW